MAMTPNTFHLTTQQQINSAIVAVLICVAIGYGFVALWRDWRRGWDAEDFADAYYANRPTRGWSERAAMRARRGR